MSEFKAKLVETVQNEMQKEQYRIKEHRVRDNLKQPNTDFIKFPEVK